jgi:hypothetical protein
VACGLATEQKAPKTPNPPRGFEVARVHFQQFTGRVIASVVYREFGWPDLGSLLEKFCHRRFVCGVSHCGLSRTAGIDNRRHNVFEPRFSAASHHNMESASCRPPGNARTKSLDCANADNDRCISGSHAISLSMNVLLSRYCLPSKMAPNRHKKDVNLSRHLNT